MTAKKTKPDPKVVDISADSLNRCLTCSAVIMAKDSAAHAEWHQKANA